MKIEVSKIFKSETGQSLGMVENVHKIIVQNKLIEWDTVYLLGEHGNHNGLYAVGHFNGLFFLKKRPLDSRVNRVVDKYGSDISLVRSDGDCSLGIYLDEHKGAIMPVYGSSGSAGLDIFLPTDMRGNSHIAIPAFEIYQIPTGIYLEIPEGYEAQLRPRSSQYRMGLDVNGTIDSDYRGEIIVVLRNLTDTTILYSVEKAICQMIINKLDKVVMVRKPKESFSVTERGDGGFGSTNKISENDTQSESNEDDVVDTPFD